MRSSNREAARLGNSVTTHRCRCIDTADDPRRQHRDDLVDDAGIERRAEHAGPPFDENAEHVSRSQQGHQGVDIDPARSLIDDLDLDAGFAESLDVLRVCPVGSGNECPAKSGVQHASPRRDAQGAVDDHPKWRPATLEPGGQLRVVGDHGVDPDQDRVVDMAKAVRERSRLVGCDPSRFTACGRDPAVERCRELGRDKGKSGGDVLDVGLVQPS